MTIQFTTALTVCSPNPVLTVVMQGMVHVTSTLLLSSSSIAVDVNLAALLQQPLCDTSCQTIMHIMNSRVCIPRGLTRSDAKDVNKRLVHNKNILKKKSYT